MSEPMPVSDGKHAEMFEYVVVFADPRPPREAEFIAINDTHAIELTKAEYPDQKWTLYRKAPEQQVRVHAN